MKKLLITFSLSALIALIIPTASFARDRDDSRGERPDRDRPSGDIVIDILPIEDTEVTPGEVSGVDVLVTQTSGRGTSVETEHDLPEDWNPLWITPLGFDSENLCNFRRSNFCGNSLIFEVPTDFVDSREVTITSTPRRGSASVERFHITRDVDTPPPPPPTEKGTLSVVLDASTPSYSIATADELGVTVGVLKFTAEDEAIRLGSVALELTGTDSLPSDIMFVHLYDGSTRVGSTVFVGSNRTTTLYLTEIVDVPKDDSKTLTIKADLMPIGTALPGTQGSLVKINFDGDSADTVGLGISSGQLIYPTSPDTSVSGVRVFKSQPIVAKLTLPSNSLVSGENILYRFAITADDANSVSLYKLTTQIAASFGVQLVDVNIYAYTNSAFTIPLSGVARADGALALVGKTILDATDTDFQVEDNSGESSLLIIPAGATRYFEIRGTAFGFGADSSISTTLRGDSAYPVLPSLMGTASDIDNDINDDFIWSPNATTTSTLTHQDWTNGFGVLGLPSNSLSAHILSN